MLVALAVSAYFGRPCHVAAQVGRAAEADADAVAISETPAPPWNLTASVPVIYYITLLLHYLLHGDSASFLPLSRRLHVASVLCEARFHDVGVNRGVLTAVLPVLQGAAYDNTRN